MEAPRVSRADTEAVVFALKEERTRAIADQQAAQAATERAIAARKAAEAEVARLGRELTLLEQEPATEGRQLVITPGTTAELDPGPAQAPEQESAQTQAAIRGLGVITSFQHQVQPQSEPEPEPEPELNFGGIWALAETEGMESFLQSLDFGYLRRTAAATLMAGLIGKLRTHIQQDGDTITFRSVTPADPEGTLTTFIIGKKDNVNENPFLGRMVADVQWEVATDGMRSLVAAMQAEDGRTMTVRRSLVPNAQPEMLQLQTTVEEASMTQRFVCEERAPAPAPEPEPEPEPAPEPAPEPEPHRTASKDLEAVYVHLDYICSKFPWPLADRDMCTASCVRKLADGRWMLVTTGIDHPTFPAGGGSFVRQVVNHWIVLEQCGADVQLTLAAVANPGGDIPTSIINHLTGQMADYFKNLQAFLQDRADLIDELVRDARETTPDCGGEHSELAQQAVEAAAAESSDMLCTGWGPNKEIGNGAVTMARKSLPGVTIDPVRCVGHVRDVTVETCGAVLMSPVAKQALSAQTLLPTKRFDRVESHCFELPRYDLTALPPTQPTAPAPVVDEREPSAAEPSPDANEGVGEEVLDESTGQAASNATQSEPETEGPRSYEGEKNPSSYETP